MSLKNEFVPYEQALTLKELGFDEPCFGYYSEKDFFVDLPSNIQYYTESIIAPTYSQAFRFFREKYGIFSSVDVNYCYKIYVNDEFFEESINYNSYEKAELECLKKLIEIFKNK